MSTWSEHAAKARSRYEAKEYTPWSLVLPMAISVALGILLADIVRLTVAAMAVKEATRQIEDSISLPNAADSTVGNSWADPPRTEVAERPRFVGLPGPSTATQYRLIRACIAGTISLREANGWSQDMSTGSPQPCVANSK